MVGELAVTIRLASTAPGHPKLGFVSRARNLNYEVSASGEDANTIGTKSNVGSAAERVWGSQVWFSGANSPNRGSRRLLILIRQEKEGGESQLLRSFKPTRVVGHASYLSVGLTIIRISDLSSLQSAFLAISRSSGEVVDPVVT